jgi:hypothetical protein
MSIASKTTSITIRFNNAEIKEGIQALKAFCAEILNQSNMVDDTVATGFIIGMATLHQEDMNDWVDRWTAYKAKVAV